MFFEFTVLGFLAGWLRGGRIKHLLTKTPQLPILVALAFGLQIGLRFAPLPRGLLETYAPFIHILSYLLLFPFIFVNRKLPGMYIIALGVLLNFLVIAVNGGAMPVSPAGLSPEALETLAVGRNFLHKPVSPETRLVFLADIIPVIGRGKISMGDIFMAAGVFYYLQQAMQRKRVKGTRSYRHR